MLNLKRAIVIALLALDGLFAFSVILSGPTLQSVIGLIFLNAIIGGPAYAVSYFLSRRSKGLASPEPKPAKGGISLSFNLNGLFSSKPAKSKSSKPAAPHVPIITKKGDAVNNTAEQRIADHLYGKQVSYDYMTLSRLGSGKRVKRSAFYLSDYGAFVLFRTRVSASEGGAGIAVDEEQEWQRMRSDVADLKFIIYRQKDVKNMEASLNSVLAQLDSLRMAG